MDFKTRFVELRKEKNYSQKYISEYMGVSQVSVSNWERGSKEPNFQTLIDLSRLFDCSCDYLLGVSDKRHNENE